MSPVLVLLVACVASADAQGTSQSAPGITLGEVIASTIAGSFDIAVAALGVRAEVGALKQASAAFDPRVRASTMSGRGTTLSFGSDGSPASQISASTVTYAAATDWAFRSGLSLSPWLSYTRVDVGGGERAAQNTGLAGLDIRMPLLRARGGGATAAAERAAYSGVEAAELALRHARALAVLDAVSAYWRYAAAAQSLRVLEESEERARNMVDQTRTLIEADERPAAESISVRAHLTLKRANRLAGEGARSVARRALAAAMGLAAERLGTLPEAADSLPVAPEPAAVAAWRGEDEWIRQAHAQRSDLAAARSQGVAARSLLAGAQRDVRSVFDLTFGVAYAGIDVGRGFRHLFSPFHSDERGVQTQLGIAYLLPAGNNAAEGQLLRSSVVDEQATLAVRELARRIALDVATSAELLRRIVEELRLAEEAVGLYARAVESENEKYRLGISTLFDVILAEDALTNAHLSWIDTRRRYVVAVAQLRFDTGTLLHDAHCDPALGPLMPASGACAP